MKYLDTNVLIYATFGAGEEAESARRILRETASGRSPSVTSSLTLDEVLWTMKRLSSREEALREATKFLAFPNLMLLDVRAKHIVAAVNLMEEHKWLGPRDAIHAAVAIDAGVFTIVSTDADFDGVPQLTRQPLVKG